LVPQADADAALGEGRGHLWEMTCSRGCSGCAAAGNARESSLDNRNNLRESSSNSVIVLSLVVNFLTKNDFYVRQ
jgi:hypothetical protein